MWKPIPTTGWEVLVDKLSQPGLYIFNSGRVPFYSYHASNIASAALAHSLGVMWYADVVAYAPA